MTRFLLAASVAAFTLAAGAASAATITFSNLTAVWQNPVGGVNVTIPTSIPPDPTASIRWGTVTPATAPQSGYDFTFSGDPIATGIGSEFALGTFTHQNFPIGDNTAITAVQLKINADVDVDGNPAGTKTFLFDFAHNETPNNANPCADGGPNGVGVNANGCADNVIPTTATATETFTIGTKQYTITIVGFKQGSSVVSSFWTKENASNSADLVATVSEKEIGIAEPASLALLGAGLLGLGFAARRRV